MKTMRRMKTMKTMREVGGKKEDEEGEVVLRMRSPDIRIRRSMRG
jgi:hypothetical protein